MKRRNRIGSLFATTGVAVFLFLTTLAVSGQKAVISIDGVKVYALPMVEHSPVTTLSKGDTVRVLGRRGRWVKVVCSDGVKGWMQLHVSKRRKSTGSKKAPHRGTNGNARIASRGGAFNGKHADGLQKDKKVAQPRLKDVLYRRFGYAFGMGLVQFDYTYNWKFVFHSTPRLALEGSFKHVLGGSADSYFITANLAYLLKQGGRTLPYVTGGLGVINTVPDRGIGTDSVSNMAINYGVGARRYINPKLSLVVAASQYTTFVGKNLSQFTEITAGVLVGRFWD